MISLISRIQHARLWDRAQQFAAKQEFSAAAGALRSINLKKFGMKAEYYLFMSYVLQRLGEVEEATECLRSARTSVLKSARFDITTKAYLLKFADYVSALNGGLEALESVSYANVPIEGVPRHLRRWLPLRMHPSWPYGE